MQLVKPSKFFSVTIFRTCSIGSRVRTWAMLLLLVTLKIFDVCTVTMGVVCIIFRPLGRNMIAIFGPDKI